MYYDMIESGKRIKELRKKKGMSQSDLAEAISIHVKTVSKAERGVIGLSVDNLLLISEYFNTTMDYLVRGHRDIAYENNLLELLGQMNYEQKEATYKIIENILKFPK